MHFLCQDMTHVKYYKKQRQRLQMNPAYDEERRKREERNIKQREYRARKRAEETTEQREERNRKQREYRAKQKAAAVPTTPEHGIRKLVMYTILCLCI